MALLITAEFYDDKANDDAGGKEDEDGGCGGSYHLSPYFRPGFVTKRVGRRGAAACHSKANKKARLVERKVCFISDASNCGSGVRGGEGGVQRPTPRHPPPPTSKRVRAFIDSVRRTALLAETAQSSLTVMFKLVISGLTSIILAVFHLFPFICSQFSTLWQLMSRVQSGCQVVNFSPWCFGICKTAHRIWLRILSIALEKELIVLDYLCLMTAAATDYIIII